jgi:hypothetical protein
MTFAQPTAANPQAVLMEGLRFTEADLQANRAGQLSDHQRDYLWLDRRKNAILGGVIAVVFTLGTGVMLFYGIQRGNPILQVLGVLLAGCNTGVVGLFGVNWVRSGYDLRTGEVDTVEGEAQHVVRQLGRAQAASIRIGDAVEVPTDVDTFKAFTPGATYRLYRTLHAHRFLSIERVHQADTI